MMSYIDINVIKCHHYNIEKRKEILSKMTKKDKLIIKTLTSKTISFVEADKVLKLLGYTPENPGSSHVTYRKDESNLITIVSRKELKPYEVKKIQEALRKEGY